MSNQISGLSAGWRTTCGIFNEQLQCFGWNQYGQIGVGTIGDQYLPVPVTTDLPTVEFVAPGVVHTCVVTKDSRRLHCWGSNDSVNLLLEDPIIYSSPQSVSAGGRVRQLTSGRAHICAVVDAGEFDQFVCWGGNEYGQLGVNSNLPSDDPIEVQLSVLPKQISAGYLHQCAVLSTDDSLWCWGLNFNGQAGVGTNENVFVPTQVLSVGPIKMVSSGYYHTCAVTTEGLVYCFGYNANGQLGNGNTEDQNTPQVVSLGGSADSVVTGRDHTCAIMMDESLKCWGSNAFGQLGVGASATQSATPVLVTNIDGNDIGGLVKIVALGKEHTCASLQDETLWCWGSNSNGQLGLGVGVQSQFLPAQVSIQFPGDSNPSPTTPSPTRSPTTNNPTRAPTRSPTRSPTRNPTPGPTTRAPTTSPTPPPTSQLTTDAPTMYFTQLPTTAKPTPFRNPTDPPTSAPVAQQQSDVEPRPTSIVLIFPTEQDGASDFVGDGSGATIRGSNQSTRKTFLSALSVALLLCWGQAVL